MNLNDETKKLYESELTVRKNDDGTYLLIIYSMRNRPIANLSIKNEFEITETLFEENLKIVEPNPGDVQIRTELNKQIRNLFNISKNKFIVRLFIMKYKQFNE
ncbi:hypothetical protein NWE60_01295 [Mycoplasmopsis felis]|nr:hypothetical protein [Mycoplasmopsis felis]WAM01285.1 hypothetical protein NWE60_01295 [Mycoplasmopsis felis]